MRIRPFSVGQALPGRRPLRTHLTKILYSSLWTESGMPTNNFKDYHKYKHQQGVDLVLLLENSDIQL